MTVYKLHKELTRLINVGRGDLPIIYAIDDEGNGYHKVGNFPTLAKVDDLKQYYLELIETEDVHSFNALIIN